jgi:pyridoxine kinase
MTGLPYKTEYDRAYIMEMLRALAALGPKYAVLTGVSFTPGKVGVMGLDSKTGETFEYYTDHVPTSYHGTGDIFASTVVGAITRGLPVADAFRIACDYTKETVAYTYGIFGHEDRYGVDFEHTLPMLVDKVRNL